MTLATQILNDLHVGPSTAHALADRMKKSTESIRLQLIRMEKEGAVRHRPICDGKLIVWYVKKNEQSPSVGATEKLLK
jgi:predicted ArsR family transcriptional regulator